MQQNDTTLGHCLDILHHVGKVQIRILGVIITVLANLKTRIGKDRNVVSPCRVGHVDMFVSLLSHQFSKNTKASSARKCLNSLDPIFLDGGRIVTVSKFEGQVNEFRFTSLEMKNEESALNAQISGPHLLIRNLKISRFCGRQKIQ